MLKNIIELGSISSIYALQNRSVSECYKCWRKKNQNDTNPTNDSTLDNVSDHEGVRFKGYSSTPRGAERRWAAFEKAPMSSGVAVSMRLTASGDSPAPPIALIHKSVTGTNNINK